MGSIQWLAQYSDGTTLPQFDPATGVENKQEAIDRTRLRAFGLVEWIPVAGERDRLSIPIMVHFTVAGQRLIYRRRTSKRILSARDLAAGVPETSVSHLVGWQMKTPDGANVQAVAVYSEDTGGIDLLPRFEESYAPFCAPVLQAFEANDPGIPDRPTAAPVQPAAAGPLEE